VATGMLVGFVANEAVVADPLLDLAIFGNRGLAAADVTQVIGVAGFGAMFFFMSLYLQSVLGYSPIKTGLAYLPVAILVGVAAGIASQLLARLGTRPLIAGGSLLAAAGVFLLSRIPVDGSYVADVLPGSVLMSLGLGAVFVAVTTAANAGVPARQAGLAAALLNASQQLGAALGLAVFSTIATSRTQDLLAAHSDPTSALASGFQRALFFSSLALVAAAVIALRAPNVKGDGHVAAAEPIGAAQ
jgi:MFS family permease